MSLKVRKNKTPRPPARCEIGECLSLIAGAWTPNLIWYLKAGPRRFNELKRDLAPITAKILSLRLKHLETHGVINRLPLDPHALSYQYGLTRLGQDLVPALETIIAVGLKLKGEARAETKSTGAGDPALETAG